MNPPKEKQAVQLAAQRLEELLESPALKVSMEPARGGRVPDAVIDTPGGRIVIEYKSSGGSGPVHSAARQVLSYAAALGAKAVPVVVVPYMSEGGKSILRGLGVSWLDLAGNASISAPGLRVFVEGRPNPFRKRGRPASPFAPKASRVARWILEHPDVPFRLTDLVRDVGIDAGQASRVLRSLAQAELVERRQDQAWTAPRPGLLLDAWIDEYRIDKHTLIKGHIPSRSGETLMRKLSSDFERLQVAHAFTGFAAAWAMTKFVGFRLVTAFLASWPTPDLLHEVSFREEPTGANVWLIVPNDSGAFLGESMFDGSRCVHPVQAYLDLQGLPERSAEAAEELRTKMLRF